MRSFDLNFNSSLAAASALCLIVAAGVSGCASQSPSTQVAANSTDNTGVQKTAPRRFFGILSPYRPDVQQGNFVSKEMMAQLKEGMTQEQVRFLLGTPLLTDMFHDQRWDYLFRLQKGNGELLTSRLTIFFKDDRVARFEGGDLPTENDFLKLIAGDSDESK